MSVKYAVNTTTQDEFDRLMNTYTDTYYNMRELTKEKHIYW